MKISYNNKTWDSGGVHYTTRVRMDEQEFVDKLKRAAEVYETVQNALNEIDINTEIRKGDTYMFLTLTQSRNLGIPGIDNTYIFVEGQIKDFDGSIESCEKLVGYDKLSEKELAFIRIKENSFHSKVFSEFSDKLKADKDIALAAINKNGYCLKHCSAELQNDKELVIAAVTKDGQALKFVNDKFKDDIEVVKAALSNIGNNLPSLVLRYASDRIRKNPELLEEKPKMSLQDKIDQAKAFKGTQEPKIKDTKSKDDIER